MKDSPQAGWLIPEWAQQARVSRASYYNFPEQCRPASVKIGKRVVITEAPADWLRRMGELGGVPSKAAA